MALTDELCICSTRVYMSTSPPDLIGYLYNAHVVFILWLFLLLMRNYYTIDFMIAIISY